MYKLLKSEIQYFKIFLVIIVLLTLVFTAFSLSNILLFENIYFLKKYFWSMIIGVGTYVLVFGIWSIRKKEMRERKHALLPITLNNVSFSRWIFGIAPFVLIGSYIELLRSILPSQQLIFIDRINGQLGMMFIALVAVDLVINTWIALETKRYDKRVIYSFILIITLIILSFGVIYSVSISIIKPLGFGGEEVIFFIGGIIISVFDAIVFTKRKLFLG